MRGYVCTGQAECQAGETVTVEVRPSIRFDFRCVRVNDAATLERERETYEYNWKPGLLVTRVEWGKRGQSIHNPRVEAGEAISFVVWMLECLGWMPGDVLDDRFPGTGIVGRCVRELSRRPGQCAGYDDRWSSVVPRAATHPSRAADPSPGAGATLSLFPGGGP